jgi:hypothetical protein
MGFQAAPLVESGLEGIEFPELSFRSALICEVLDEIRDNRRSARFE